MTWYKKSFSNEAINSAEYQNMIREISSQYNQNPEKLDDFAVFKEELDDESHLLYFSPTDDPTFTTIVNKSLEAEECEKPNLNNAKLFMGKYI